MKPAFKVKPISDMSMSYQAKNSGRVKYNLCFQNFQFNGKVFFQILKDDTYMICKFKNSFYLCPSI